MVAHAHELTPGDGHGHAHGGGPTRSVWLRGSWVRAAWVTVLSACIGFYGVELVRSWLFGWPAYNQGVSDVFMMLLGGVGFTIGIGCWDYWWGYLIGRPGWVAEDHSQHGAYSWKDYFKVNTDHKVIGVQYLVTTFAFFMIAGALAELMRAELAAPGMQYFCPASSTACSRCTPR